MLTQKQHKVFIRALSTSIQAVFSLSARTKTILAVTILLAMAVVMRATVSSAASPSSGTISATSGPLSYTAGPFVVANESGQGGVLMPVCQPGTALCDEYLLTVNAASAAATKKLLIRIQWPTAG